MSRYIDEEHLMQKISRMIDFCGKHKVNGLNALFQVGDAIMDCPTADVVEVRHDFNVGDFCLYGFEDGNKSLAIVEIVRILDDVRGIAEVKFHKVIRDNTGNGFFHYLFKNGKTMNASFKYLKNITPKIDGERKEE